MPEFASVSSSELANRRKKLKQQRRLKVLQSCWRSLLIAGLAATSLWVITLPNWVIRRPEQVTVEGNEHLSPTTVQALLPIDYPQSLWALQPEAIATDLEAHAPIAKAIVTRHLFPPGLTVRIQERHPVAIAYGMLNGPVPDQTSATTTSRVGLLDEEGNWMPIENYTELSQPMTLPSLKVIGMQPETQSQWKALYQAIAQSPVKVFEINWQNPSNLILTTELGVIHLGPFSSQISDQLQALDQMRQLPTRIPLEQILYINLKNPDAPLVEMNQPLLSPQLDTSDELQSTDVPTNSP
jgi:cell division protein FtsQ